MLLVALALRDIDVHTIIQFNSQFQLSLAIASALDLQDRVARAGGVRRGGSWVCQKASYTVAVYELARSHRRSTHSGTPDSAASLEKPCSTSSLDSTWASWPWTARGERSERGEGYDAERFRSGACEECACCCGFGCCCCWCCSSSCALLSWCVNPRGNRRVSVAGLTPGVVPGVTAGLTSGDRFGVVSVLLARLVDPLGMRLLPRLTGSG